MAKKVALSLVAEKQRLSILEYYYIETKSKTIPSKIYSEINDALELIQRFPNSGFETNKSNRRCIIKNHYKILYHINKEDIIIVSIWDTRQNPKRSPYDRK